jgi:hypothetical protein
MYNESLELAAPQHTTHYTQHTAVKMSSNAVVKSAIHGFVSPAGKLLTGNIGSLCEQRAAATKSASRS